MGDVAAPLPPPVGGQEVVPAALIAKLREHRDVLGPKWVDLAISMIEARDAFGRGKYGQSLHTFDGRSPHLDALQELIDLFQYLHKAEMEHAQLTAENAGLRAKVAVLERERDAARENFLVARDARDEAVTSAERAEAMADEAERALRGPPSDPDREPMPCDPIPDVECEARQRCTDNGGCPAFPKGILLGRIS